MSEKNKPTAIFICGPIAAGKSSTAKWFEKVGYEQGLVMNYDSIFKSEYDRLRKENKAVPEAKVHKLAEDSALAARESLYNSCIKNKMSFSYENCLSTWAFEGMKNVFDKMEDAKKNGFEVRAYVTFQNSLEKHIRTEKDRRKGGKETGAFFKNNLEAKKGVTNSYTNCLDGIEKALKHSHSMKVFINYMDSETNKPKLVGHYKNGVIQNVTNKVTNPDLAKKLDQINNAKLTAVKSQKKIQFGM
jgi:predicted ABC-type ATPase